MTVRRRKHRRVDGSGVQCLRERGPSKRRGGRCRLVQRIAAHEDEREAGRRHPDLAGIRVWVACDSLDYSVPWRRPSALN